MEYPIITDTLKRQAADHLAAHDPQLAAVVARGGLTDMAPHTDYYHALISSIIGQQLSVKAAATIKQRFQGIFGGRFPEPHEILETPLDKLRTAGLSNAKANYVQDLARHIIDGRITFDDIDTLANEAIIKKLTGVKGIGEWTAHMFLMFCVGRPDILAAGDLGIRTGVRNLYGLGRLPTPTELAKIAEKHGWHPYESIACWYIWYSLDNKPM